MKQFAVVILAAGASSRMGSPKQLLAFEGSTFLQHTIQTARQVFDENVFVVLGANATVILEHLHSDEAHIIINEKWQAGMGSSIALGVRKVAELMPQLSGIMFMTIDQPYVSVQHLNELVRLYAQSNKPIVASEYNNTAGIPAIFDKTVFPQLLELHTDRGAKEIIKLHRENAILVPLALGEIDIDTPGQYAELKFRQSE